MRQRYIKPGILCNEDIADMGPYAFILYVGLWMIADREGRIEYRPKRIKGLVMPLWTECTADMVEQLLLKFCGKRMLIKYTAPGFEGVEILQIAKWAEHQRPDPREAKSVLPPPTAVESPVTSDNGITLTSQRNSHEQTGGEWGMGNGNSSSSVNGDGVVLCAAAETPPPEPPKPTPSPSAPKRKPPATDRAEPPRKLPVVVGNKRSLSDRPVARAGPEQLNFWPHRPEDVAVVRNSLDELATQVGMPPPDDGIVRRVLDVGRGAPGVEIHAVLVTLWKRNKFKSMYSWGFVPVVVAPCFSPIAAAS